LKLLFDQNFSRKLPGQLGDIFPNSLQVVEVTLAEADKDADFQQRSLLYEAHPIYPASNGELLHAGHRIVPPALQPHRSPLLLNSLEAHLILH
jgi:hypothetical protein